MRRIVSTTVALLAALTVVAVGATVSSAATNHFWEVEAKPLAVGKANGKVLKAKTAPGSKWVLEATVLGLPESVECENISITSGLAWNETVNGNTVGFDKGDVQISGKCKASVAGCSVPEPIVMPPKAATGESLLVQEEGGTKKIFDDLLPEENAASQRIFAEVKLTGGVCPTVIVESSPALGKQGKNNNEGEAGVLGEVEEPEVSKVGHNVKFVCPAEPKAAINGGWSKRIIVNTIETSAGAHACLKGEATLELGGFAWSTS
jgi:FlaG/FlaF family flagellin (archaellin)